MKKGNIVLCFVLSLVMALSLALPLSAMQTPGNCTAYNSIVAESEYDGLIMVPVDNIIVRYNAELNFYYWIVARWYAR